jgi:hypothetical protein
MAKQCMILMLLNPLKTKIEFTSPLKIYVLLHKEHSNLRYEDRSSNITCIKGNERYTPWQKHEEN